LFIKRSIEQKWKNNINKSGKDKTKSLVAEPEGSTLLIPKSSIGHDPEPFPSTSDPQNLSP
jgi:hypothetical protein